MKLFPFRTLIMLCTLMLLPQIEEQIEEMFASVSRVVDVATPMVNQQPAPSSSNQQKLEIAKRMASMISMQKNIGAEAPDKTQMTAAAIFKGGGIAAPQVSVGYSVAQCNHVLY